MTILNEIKHALKDGMDRSEAKKYELLTWDAVPKSALAYSKENKEVLLLILADGSEDPLSGDQYLEIGKHINKHLKAFVSPSQKIGGVTAWAGKTKGPVYVYRFKVLNPSELAQFNTL